MNNLKVGDKFKSSISHSVITIKQISINTILIHRSRRNDLLSLSYNEALDNLESGCWEYIANNVQYTEEL